jgi:hypothetical protein
LMRLKTGFMSKRGSWCGLTGTKNKKDKNAKDSF